MGPLPARWNGGTVRTGWWLVVRGGRVRSCGGEEAEEKQQSTQQSTAQTQRRPTVATVCLRGMRVRLASQISALTAAYHGPVAIYC